MGKSTSIINGTYGVTKKWIIKLYRCRYWMIQIKRFLTTTNILYLYIKELLRGRISLSAVDIIKHDTLFSEETIEIV